MIAAFLAAAAVSAAPADLPAWLAGTWGQAKKTQTVTEMWLAPQDGAMAGVTLTTRPGRPPRAEYAKITREPAGLTYTAVVGTQPPVPFVAIPAEGGWLVFENKAHDFPQRVAYRPCDVDLCAAIEGLVNGKLERQEWRYKRNHR
jgi:hypothetical protein